MKNFAHGKSLAFKKKKDAARALLKKSLFVFLLTLTSVGVARANTVALQPTSSCQELPAKNGFSYLNSELDQLLTILRDALQSSNARELLPYFHPRMKVERQDLENIFSKNELLYQTPFEVSV